MPLGLIAVKEVAFLQLLMDTLSELTSSVGIVFCTFPVIFFHDDFENRCLVV